MEHNYTLSKETILLPGETFSIRNEIILKAILGIVLCINAILFYINKDETFIKVAMVIMGVMGFYFLMVAIMLTSPNYKPRFEFTSDYLLTKSHPLKKSKIITWNDIKRILISDFEVTFKDQNQFPTSIDINTSNTSVAKNIRQTILKIAEERNIEVKKYV